MPNYVVQIIGAQSKSSSTQCQVPYPVVPSGALMLAYIVFDNLTQTTPYVTSVSQTGSNSLSKVASWDAPTTGSASGVRSELWALENAAASTNAVVVTLSEAVVAKAAIVLTAQDTGNTPLKVLDVATRSGNGSLSTSSTPITVLDGEYVLTWSGTESATGGMAAATAMPSTLLQNYGSYSVSTTGQGSASNVYTEVGWFSVASGWAGGEQQLYAQGSVVDGGIGIAVIGPPRTPPPIPDALPLKWWDGTQIRTAKLRDANGVEVPLRSA